MATSICTKALKGPQSVWLTDSLELLEELGKGATATVWDAMDHERGMRVAVKPGCEKPPAEMTCRFAELIERFDGGWHG